MVRYIKSGTEVKISGLEEILKWAEDRPIACISACTDDNSGKPDERANATNRLRARIQARYDFVEVNGGWLEPLEDGGSKETTEESFIVIGNKYDSPVGSVDGFIDDMVALCNEFKQWAVLVIDYAEDISKITPEQRKMRSDAYKTFSDPKYIEDDLIDQLGGEDAVSNEYDVYDDVNSIPEDLDVYELHGVYYDGNGAVKREFFNVTPKHIASYFTTTARKAGASKFTLLSSMQLRGRYVADSLAHKYQVGWNSRLPIEAQVDLINRYMNSRFYPSHLKSTYDELSIRRNNK